MRARILVPDHPRVRAFLDTGATYTLGICYGLHIRRLKRCKGYTRVIYYIRIAGGGQKNVGSREKARRRVGGCSLYIGGLGSTTNSGAVQQHFRAYGSIECAEIMYDHANKPRGFSRRFHGIDSVPRAPQSRAQIADAEENS